MMSNVEVVLIYKEDLTGKKFGRLTVIKEDKNRKEKDKERVKLGLIKRSRIIYWLCKCDCGKENISVSTSNLKTGNTKSCGCLQKEMMHAQKWNKKVNRYDLSGEYGIGYTSNDEIFYFDLEDYNKIKNYCWYKNADGYLCAKIGDKKGDVVKLHNLIYLTQNDKVADHINGKPEDNRKYNLREATDLENTMNRKVRKDNKLKVKGVTKRGNCYVARITVNKKLLHLGSFKNLDDAIKARKEAEIKYFGAYSTYLSRGDIDYSGVG